MNISELSASQLRHAATIKDELAKLQAELTSIFGGATPAPTAAAAPQKQKMSPAAKAKLSAKLKEIWAKRKAAKQPSAVVPQAKTKGKMSPAAKALLSAKLKAYWAKRKAAKTAKMVLAPKAASKTVPAITPAPKKKWKLSAVGMARIKAASKAYWAKKKAAKK